MFVNVNYLINKAQPAVDNRLYNVTAFYIINKSIN